MNRRKFLGKVLGIATGFSIAKLATNGYNQPSVEKTFGDVTLDTVEVFPDGSKRNIEYEFVTLPEFTTLEDTYEEMVAHHNWKGDPDKLICTENIPNPVGKYLALCSVTFKG